MLKSCVIYVKNNPCYRFEKEEVQLSCLEMHAKTELGKEELNIRRHEADTAAFSAQNEADHRAGELFMKQQEVVRRAFGAPDQKVEVTVKPGHF